MYKVLIILLLTIVAHNGISQNLKVMSFNILDGGDGKLDDIFAVIEDNDADIVLMQETSTQNELIDSVAEARGYYFYKNNLYANSVYEPAILSKYPFIEKSLQHRLVDVLVQLDDTTQVKVYSIHLPPLELNTERQYLLYQISREHLRMDREEYPTIIAGDFNVYSHQSEVLGILEGLEFEQDVRATLDYIYSYGLNAVGGTAITIGNTSDPDWPSDHPAVYVEYEWPSFNKNLSSSYRTHNKALESFSFSQDSFEAHTRATLDKIIIDQLPGKGVLKLNDNEVSVYQVIDAADINNLNYENTTIGLDGIKWRAISGIDTSTVYSNVFIENTGLISFPDRKECIYEVSYLNQGQPMFFGSSVTYHATNIEEIEGAEFVQLPTYIKYWTNEEFNDYFSLHVNQDAYVYVMLDEYYVNPLSWITENFEKIDGVFSSSVRTMSAYRTRVDSGLFEFGTHGWFDWNSRGSVLPMSIVVVPRPEVIEYMDTILFGAVDIGRQKQIEFTILNDTKGDISVRLEASRSELSLSKDSVVVGKGELDTFQFIYTPEFLDTFEHEVSIYIGDTLYGTVFVSGEGQSYRERGASDDFEEADDANGWGGDQEIIITEENGELSLDIDFPDDEWKSIVFIFDSIDISEHPYINFDLKSDQDVEVQVEFIDANGVHSNSNPQYVSHTASSEYQHYEVVYDTEDLKDYQETALDQGAVNRVLFLINRGVGFTGDIKLDNVVVGDGGSEKVEEDSTDVGGEDSTITYLNEEFSSFINIYPNPSSGIFTIETSEIGTVEVHSYFGQKVFSEDIRNTSYIDLKNYDAGLYYVSITANNKTIRKKLILYK